MRGRDWVLWGWILVAGGGWAGTSATPPPEAAGIFPQAVVLREVQALEAPDVHHGFVLLGVADLDGDEIPDLVVGGDRAVRVLLGDGRGRFTPGPWVYVEVEEYNEEGAIPGRYLGKPGEARWVPYELEEEGDKRYVPVDVYIARGVLADLDGDGIPDVAVRGSAPDGNHIYFLRGTGGGKFVRVSKIPYPRGPYVSRRIWAFPRALFFTVAEADEPNRLYRVDLRGGLGDPRVEVVLEGEFQLGWAGDLDGDGVADLVLFRGEEVWVLRDEGERLNRGPGFTLEEEVRGVAVADLNGDGALDLVVRTPTGIVTGLGRGFAVAFSQKFTFPLWAHYLGDLTGDGIPDLLVQSSMGFFEFHLLPGDGRGGFLSPVYSFVLLDGIPLEPWFVDLNGDGLSDVVFGPSFGPSRTIRILLNGGAYPGTSLHPLPGGLLAAGDLSGNGAPDLLVADVVEEGVRVLWNAGRGELIPGSAFAVGRVPLAGAIVQDAVFLLLPPTQWLPNEVVALDTGGEVIQRWRVSSDVLPNFVVADLDGDGVLDVALPAKDGLLVFWGLPGMGWRLRTYPWPQGEVSLLAAGEGRLWAVAIGEYADLVEVGFEGRRLSVSAPVLRLEALPLAMTAGDLDGDGSPDPVVLGAELGAVAEGEEVEVFIQRVVAGMALSSSGPMVEEVPGFPKDQAPWPFLGVVVVRMEGKAYLVCTASGGGGVFLVPWEGTFGEPIGVDVPGGPLVAADLDGNGVPEILTSTLGLGTLLVILWNGGGR